MRRERRQVLAAEIRPERLRHLGQRIFPPPVPTASANEGRVLSAHVERRRQLVDRVPQIDRAMHDLREDHDPGRRDDVFLGSLDDVRT